jgi:hypothetical protein
MRLLFVGGRSACLVIFCAALSITQLGMAQTIPGDRATPALEASPAWSVSAAAGRSHYRARETNALGFVTNKENGHLPSQAVGLRWLTSPWFAQLSAQRAASDVLYQGYTQIGLPLTTTTELALSQWQLQAGWQWQGPSGHQIQLGTGLSQSRIDRNILPGFGSLPLRETLHTRQWLLAADWQKTWAGAWPGPLTLSLSGQLLPTLKQTLDVDSYGIYDPIRLSNARGTDWALGAKGKIAITPQAQVTLQWHYRSIQPRASSLEVWRKNGFPAATVRYPGSRQSARDIAIGVDVSF